MDHNSHPDTWVEPQFQSTAASSQHQLYPSSSYTWGDPLTYSAPQQLQQYKQDPRKQESFGVYNLDLVHNASTKTSQNDIHESPLPGTQPMEVSHHPVSQALGEGGLQQCLAEYKLTICRVFQSIISGRLEDASEQLLKATGWLLENVEDLGEFKSSLRSHSLTISLVKDST